MSLSIEEQVYASDTVKTAAPPRIPGYYPSTQPHPHYLDVLRSSTVEELQPLKSLGRLVTQSSPLMPFPVGNFAFLNQSPPAAEGICSVALFTKTLDSASPVYPRGRDTPAIQPPRPAALCCPGQRQGKRHRLQPNNSAQHPGPQPTGASQPGQPQPTGAPQPGQPQPQPTGASQPGQPQPQPTGAPQPQPGHPQPQPGHPQPQPGHFTEQHLNTVLYGRMNSDSHHGPVSHAISGLRISGNTGGHQSHVQLLDRDPVQIPAGLAVSHTYYGGVPHQGVFCSQNLIPKGVRFGPFTGKVVNMSEIKTYDDNSYMWEIFEDGRLSHFIDGKGAASNWMSLVNCARSPQEQNLTALQSEGKIFYETCKDVVEKQELLVWYGDCYLQFMGIPVTLKEMIESQLAEQAEENAEGFKCDRCGKVFAYKYYRDKHLKYTRCVDQGDRKYPCNLCSRSFEKRDRLRIHILHVHEKHRPHKCSVCGKSFSQSSSLNKHTRVHSGERPYKCVYCNKAFTASSILRTHIRQHSGEKPFKCRHCGKAFASHAAHDSHVRRTHSKDKMFSCETCKKTFMEARELSYHQAQHHAGEGRQVGAVATQELHSMPTDQTDSMTGDYLYNSSEEPLTTPQNADKGESNPYRVATGGTILHNDGYRPWN